MSFQFKPLIHRIFLNQTKLRDDILPHLISVTITLKPPLPKFTYYTIPTSVISRNKNEFS